jgi:glycerol-1-phosphate dehydrogenase [NAD(P)+]
METMRPNKVTVDENMLDHLVAFCREEQRTRLLLLADRNTWAVQGESVHAALAAAGCDVKTLIFQRSEVVADAEHVFQTLIALDNNERTLLAVGSGTITDITRFVAHRTRGQFISIPTAPSVDAYVSVGAPMIVNGVKVTYTTMSPIGVFADIRTLMAAPRPMIAAGFGDVMAKFTSVADFRLGHLLWDEPFDAEIADRMLATARTCAENAAEIASASRAGISALIQALLDSGYCMVDFGNSRPASGTEHHYSHFWEMKLLQEGRPAILHGAKTGVGTVLGAEIYAQMHRLSRADVADLLEATALPDPELEVATIERVYGQLASEVIDDQRSFIDMDPERFEQIKRRILDNWESVQEIAADVPLPKQVASWLHQVGGPTTVQELGLSVEERRMAEQYAHYLRNRFTVRKLARVLGVMV